jgi:hypothetical protein
MRTVVVTDSSGRPWPATASPAVVVVPITIMLAARQVADDEIDPAQVDEAMSRGDPVKTRAPSVMDYLDAVESTDAQAAVILTPAAELTARWPWSTPAPPPAGRRWWSTPPPTRPRPATLCPTWWLRHETQPPGPGCWAPSGPQSR